jgi:hypothetical protein
MKKLILFLIFASILLSSSALATWDGLWYIKDDFSGSDDADNINTTYWWKNGAFSSFIADTVTGVLNVTLEGSNDLIMSKANFSLNYTLNFRWRAVHLGNAGKDAQIRISLNSKTLKPYFQFSGAVYGCPNNNHMRFDDSGLDRFMNCDSVIKDEWFNCTLYTNVSDSNVYYYCINSTNQRYYGTQSMSNSYNNISIYENTDSNDAKLQFDYIYAWEGAPTDIPTEQAVADVTAPTITSSGVNDTSVKVRDIVNASIVCTDDTSVSTTFYEWSNSTTTINITCDEDGNCDDILTIEEVYGETITWTPFCNDTSGNTAAGTQVSITLSNTIPEVVYTSLDKVIITTSFNYSGTYTDDDRSAGACTLWINTSTGWNATYSNESIPSGSTFTLFNNETLSEGAWLYQANCTDGTDINYSSINKIRVDLTKPIISCSNPLDDNSTFINSELTLNCTIWDVYNLDAWSFDVKNSTNHIIYQNSTTNIADTTSTIADTLNTSIQEDQNFTIDIYVNDTASNSPPIPNLHASPRQYDIDYVDEEAGINYTVTYSLLNPAENPISMIGKNLVFNIIEDGEHIEEGFCVDINNNQKIQKTYHSNNELTFRLLQGQLAGHFIIGNKYTHHQKDVDDGLSVEIDYNGDDIEVIIYNTSGEYGGRICTHSALTGEINTNHKVIMFTQDTTAPTYTDISVFPTPNESLFQPLNLTINWTDAYINTSTVKFYFEINDSIDGLNIVYNGTETQEIWEITVGTSVTDGNTISYYSLNPELRPRFWLPATYNINESWMLRQPKEGIAICRDSSSEGNAGTVIIEIENITTLSSSSYTAEIGLSRDNPNKNVQWYMCNSSFKYMDDDYETSTNCFISRTILSSDTFDHSHNYGNFDQHYEAPFMSDSSSTVLGVTMTNTMYAIFSTTLNPQKSGFYLNYTTGEDMENLFALKNSSGWFNITGIPSFHVHQIRNTTLSYYSTAYDLVGNLGNSTVDESIVSATQKPPVVNVLSPQDIIVDSIITINWTAFDPNNDNFTINITLVHNANNSIAYSILSNAWHDLSETTFNTRLVSEGYYKLRIDVNDSLQRSFTLGNNFTIDQPAPSTYCGDGACNGLETSATCPQDCEPGETATSGGVDGGGLSIDTYESLGVSVTDTLQSLAGEPPIFHSDFFQRFFSTYVDPYNNKCDDGESWLIHDDCVATIDMVEDRTILEHMWFYRYITLSLMIFYVVRRDLFTRNFIIGLAAILYLYFKGGLN